MPSCFQLSRKGEKFEPLSMNLIDREIAEHFGMKWKNPDTGTMVEFREPTKENPHAPWFADWYNIIGWKLAMGKRFEQIKNDLWTSREEYLDQGKQPLVEYYDLLIKINEFIFEAYTPDSFVEIGRH